MWVKSCVIDRACRALSDCLKCSEFDYGISKKCHPHVGYRYESLEDPELGLKSITCLDEKTSCPRSMCECDRRFLQTSGELMPYSSFIKFNLNTMWIAKTVLTAGY